ncbi:MAG: hypothetical protein B7Z14_17165 [Bosea sp. 32-68-6]|nr:MAG: hypothetical protein B7Z14_17165 [Bosea sp. 32-68-6]
MYFPIFWDEKTGRVSLERLAPSDCEILPIRGDGVEGRWRWGIDKVRKHLDWMHPKRSDRTGRLDVEHRVYLDTSIAIEDEPDDDEEDEGVVERTSKPKSFWLGGEFSTDSGKRALKELLPGEVFDFPKSIDFLRTCILLGTSGDDIVMDLFAGSGATAQAVMQQNAIDSQSRRFICVQLPEPLDPSDKAQKAGASLCDKLKKPRNIAELTKERIRRAAAKVKAENPLFGGDFGFRVFKLDSSNIRAWNPAADGMAQTLLAHAEHLLPGRTDDDVLADRARQILSDETRDRIRRPARGIGHDERDRLGREALRPKNGRGEDGAGHQAERGTTGQRHELPPGVARLRQA